MNPQLFVVICLLAASQVNGLPLELDRSRNSTLIYDDATIPPRPDGREITGVCDDATFKCLWVNSFGQIVNVQGSGPHLEIAATQLIDEYSFYKGAEIIQLMVRNMPSEVFSQLATRGSVGLFTTTDKTTIFPEYIHLRDTPQCAGRCDGNCAVTCTSDGRKYDDLAGVGGTRGTCVLDNFMCTPSDPYGKTSSILIHEFAHTIHQYALPQVDGDWWNRIYYAWDNAYYFGIWDRSSYAMVNHLEYFAEATATFFNVNHHWISSGGMNSCGKGSGQYCSCPEDARAWLKEKDPQLYEALVYTFVTGDENAVGGLHICMDEPNNIDCELICHGITPDDIIGAITKLKKLSK